jgi:hypothetical protein
MKQFGRAESYYAHRNVPFITAIQMNHERLPRHCIYRAIFLMTSRGQIRHILNTASSFSAKFSITSREIF